MVPPVGGSGRLTSRSGDSNAPVSSRKISPLQVGSYLYDYSIALSSDCSTSSEEESDADCSTPSGGAERRGHRTGNLLRRRTDDLEDRVPLPSIDPRPGFEPYPSVPPGSDCSTPPAKTDSLCDRLHFLCDPRVAPAAQEPTRWAPGLPAHPVGPTVVGSPVCMVCTTAPSDATFVHGETSHTCCCLACADKRFRNNGQCPICRKRIDKVIKNFIEGQKSIVNGVNYAEYLPTTIDPYGYDTPCRKMTCKIVGAFKGMAGKAALQGRIPDLLVKIGQYHEERVPKRSRMPKQKIFWGVDEHTREPIYRPADPFSFMGSPPP